MSCRALFGVLEGSEHPVAVHVELSAVRIGQLTECIAVPDQRPRHRVGCHHSRVTFFRILSHFHPV